MASGFESFLGGSPGTRWCFPVEWTGVLRPPPDPYLAALQDGQVFVGDYSNQPLGVSYFV